jgi:GntR family transcriptional regulator
LRDEGVIELRRGRGAIVREGSLSAASVRHLVAELVAEAERRGVSVDEVVDMVKKEFS